MEPSSLPPLFHTILLAAGASRRMGRPKQLLPVGDSTLLRSAVTNALALGRPLVVIVGAKPDLVTDHLDGMSGFHVVENENWESGMGSSIAAGVRWACLRPVRGFLILLADQPLLDTAALQRLANAFAGDPDRIVATAYPEGPGVPAIFPVCYGEVLTNLQTVGGAKGLLRSAGEKLTLVDLGNTTVDVDTPEDYARFSGRKLKN